MKYVLIVCLLLAWVAPVSAQDDETEACADLVIEMFEDMSTLNLNLKPEQEPLIDDYLHVMSLRQKYEDDDGLDCATYFPLRMAVLNYLSNVQDVYFLALVQTISQDRENMSAEFGRSSERATNFAGIIDEALGN